MPENIAKINLEGPLNIVDTLLLIETLSRRFLVSEKKNPKWMNLKCTVGIEIFLSNKSS
jgi:hypothetical protein